MQGPIFEEKGVPEMVEQVKHVFLYLDELSSVSGRASFTVLSDLHIQANTHTVKSKKLEKKG